MNAEFEDGKIIKGEAVKQIPKNKLWEYASQVSSGLTMHPFTMVQFSLEQLLEVMNEGRAILYLGIKSENLLGFGQIWLLENNSNKKIYEFGSWLSFTKGGGKAVIIGARDLCFDLFPDSQLVALVEQDNKRAQEVIKSLGDIPVGLTYSRLLRSPTLMEKYDITKRK